MLEFLSQLPLDLRELFLQARVCASKLVLFGLKAARNRACVLLDLLELLDLGDEVGKLGIVRGEELRVLPGHVAHRIAQFVLVLGDQAAQGEDEGVCSPLHTRERSGVLLEPQALLELVGDTVLLEFFQAEVGIDELGLIVALELGGVAELEPALGGFPHPLALGFDVIAQHAELFADQLFHQIGFETFAGAGEVFLPEVDRAAQHGFPDRHAWLQLAVQIDVGCFAENAGDGEFLPVHIAGNQRHFAAAAEGVADQFILVLGVLSLLAPWNAEGIAHRLQDGRLAAAPDADERIEFGREVQRLPVEDAAVEVNAANVRCLMLRRLRRDTRGGIAQGELDRLEGQFAQLEITDFALSDFVDALGVAAFQFGGVPVLQPTLDFGAAGPIFARTVMGAHLLEAQGSAPEEFILPQLG